MMGRGLRLCLLGLIAAATPAAAQRQGGMPPFEELAYVTCSEAQAMEPARRVEVARFLANHAAAHYGIALQETGEAGRELGILVRGACTMFPQAYLFGVVAQAVRVEAERLMAER
jgi:hypothetical protein